MSDVLVEWRGLTFGDGFYAMNQFTGWLGLPGAVFQSDGSTRGHGVRDSPGVHGARVILAGGYLDTTDEVVRDGLVAELRAAMIPRRSDDAASEPLVVSAAGRTDTALAQLVNFTVDMDVDRWRFGLAPWLAQWRCPDPRIFSPEFTTVAPLVTASVGALLPKLMPFVMPDQPIGGQVTVDNPGSDPEGSPTIIALIGGQSGTVGVTNATTGRTLMYGLGLAPGDVLTIDTEEGGARFNGEYRPTLGPDVTSSLRAVPGVNVYRALGTPGAGSPVIAVTVRPASW